MTTHSMIFVNLPVSDLAATRTFWSSLGYTFNEQFSDENALCLVFSDSIFAMLLKPEFFQTFTPRPVADGSSVEVLTSLSVESREAVDSLVEAAVAAGGAEYREATDMGMMYQRSFSDLDKHSWEIVWMDPSFTG